jgi:hypothetical protein
MAATAWPTNGHLIADVHRLGYLLDGDVVLDPTFGEGVWWSVWRPRRLSTFHRPSDGSDFRKMPHRDGVFDAAAYDPPYVCASLDTEILTQRGWQTHDHVNVGEPVLTINRDTGAAEWQPLLGADTYPSGGRLVSMAGASHSSLTTPNHRWPVLGKSKALPYQWDRSDAFRADSTVPLAAPLAAPADPKWSDALVEVVAWFWTEGHIELGRDVQAAHAPGRCALIREALRALFGDPVDAFPRTGRTTDGTPRWREALDGHKVVFWLSADAGRLLLEHAPGRVPTHQFLLSLTASQLQLFIDRSLLADGHAATHAGRQVITLGQRNRAAAEAFQFAAILAGWATSLREVTSDPRGSMWLVRLRTRQFLKPSRLRRVDVLVPPDSLVWCPRTPNETWLARRGGTVYFTGNCPGGRRTSTIQGMHTRFGMNATHDDGSALFSTPAELQQIIDDGMTEMVRVVKPRGIILAKCQDYIWSGRLWEGATLTRQHAVSLGCEVVDRLDMVTSPRPQPSTNRDGTPRRQVHARRNLSTLWVLRTPKAASTQEAML